jgi:glyoxylase-like metal-dependent hydrolase (beta-lactamase superfamily II)
MDQLEPYEVYAVRYAHHANRKGSENFIGGDDHEIGSPLDYFVWAIRGPTRTFVVDSGFDEETARRRNRGFIRCPGEGLRQLGLNPAEISDVIVTHMHFDHAGNHGLFPQATYHLQDAEMEYCTGRCMCHPALNAAYEPDDVAAMVRKVFQRRVQFHGAVDQLAPGLTLHRLGGHTRGLQVVRVWTRRGWLVLASDASHLYANMEQGRPFPIVESVADMLEGYNSLRRLADGPQNIIPGHDPLVMARYPSPRSELQGVVVRLDVAPLSP